MMLDEILGRATLKDRIDELEVEREKLHRQLEAESDRRAAAVTERQEAQRQVNRLEDRIAELEDRIDRATTGGSDPTPRNRELLSGDRLGQILDRLESVETDAEGALTAFVTDAQPPAAVSEVLGDRVALVARSSPCYVFVDDAAVCSVALEPPIEPEPFVAWSDGFLVDRSHFEPTGAFTLALVRSDLFAIGEYQDSDRVGFHGFDSRLERNHSKGGFSQARFERVRDQQIDDHLDRVRAALEERTTDRLYLVGERSVLGELNVDADGIAFVDATGDPESALDDAFHDFWTTTLTAI